MLLIDYISDMRRREALARAISKSPDYLWQVATQRRRASGALAISIDEATDGEVPKSSLRPDFWPAQAPTDA